VTTSANDPGQDVAVSVSGGTYGQGFLQNQGAGKSASATASVAATACGDQRDLMIAEYSLPQNLVTLRPTCPDFTQTSPSSNYAFVGPGWPSSGSNYLNWSTYRSWAILRSYLGSNLDALVSSGPPFGIVILSGYRNPAKQQTYWKGTRNSRHTYGDAVDVNTYRSNAQWQLMHDFVRGAAAGVYACIEPIAQSSNNHLHMDWEPWSACPAKFQQ
jgi:hypothetical protein